MEENQKKKKPILLILGVTLIVAFIILAFFLFPKEDDQEGIIEFQRDPVLVAEETLGWIENQRIEEGVYKIACSCTDESCTECSSSVDAWRENGPLIWSRAKAYEKNLDSRDLAIINQDLSFILNDSPTNQWAFWHCRILKEVWESDYLPQETRDNIYQSCEILGYWIPETQFSGEGLLEEISIMISAIINDTQINISYDPELAQYRFIDKASLSSEFLTRSSLEVDINFDEVKKIGVRVFLESLYGYYSLREEPSISRNAVLGVASLDMYSEFNDEKYIDFAKYLYEDSMAQIESHGFDSYGASYHLFLTREMNRITGETRYINDMRRIAAELVREEEEGSIYHRNGYFYNFRSPNFYSIRENALLTGIFLETNLFEKQ